MPVYKDPSPHRKIYTDHDIVFFVSLVPPPALLIPAGGGINFRPPSRAKVGGAPGTRTQYPGLKRPLLYLVS